MTLATAAALAAAKPAPAKHQPSGKTGPLKLNSSDVIVVLMLELAGVSVLTLAAGVNDSWGNAIVWFMIGLWLIYLVTDASNVVAKFSNALSILGGAVK